jgi:short-subunit dehydrogenase
MASRSQHKDQTALVTGASAGIGLELAQELAARGFDLALVARREAELSELARRLESEHGIRSTCYPLDLLSDGAGEQLQTALERDGIAIDMLVNNAGVIEVGAFHKTPLEQLLRLVQLNAAVVAELSHRFLAPMLERGHGRILNVASLAAFQPVPSLALYAATKAFVLSLTESLSEELKGTGVTVTALCPGLTQTDMVEKAQHANALARMAPGFLISDSGEVAREGVDACLSGRVIVVPGAPNRLQASLVGLYPRSLVRTLGGMLGRRGL